jgi:hypothetical protein
MKLPVIHFEINYRGYRYPLCNFYLRAERVTTRDDLRVVTCPKCRIKIRNGSKKP